jgi:aspartyl protease family protein
VRRRFSGEFIVPAKVNNRTIPFIFDTGASSVVLAADDAAAAGIPISALEFDAPIATANGAATAAVVRLEQIVVGPIVVKGVWALVARHGALKGSLLGMSFLERLKSYGVENGKLVLRGK